VILLLKHQSEYTALEVAQWMASKLEGKNYLYQIAIIKEIRKKFGKPHFYKNKNGHLAISDEVLKEFKNITPDLIWDKQKKYWRYRDEYDIPIKRQTD